MRKLVTNSIKVGIVALALVGVTTAPAHADEIKKSCTSGGDTCWTDSIYFHGVQ